MLGNLVAPAVAQRIGEALQQDLAMQARPAGGGAAE
jgi:hypothetical protein